MLVTEVRDLLRELVAQTGAETASIGVARRRRANTRPALVTDESPGQWFIESQLGGDAVLTVRFTRNEPPSRVSADVERCGRALRAAARRWNESLPELEVPPAEATDTGAEKVLARIVTYLVAFANTEGLRNAAVTVTGECLASAQPLSGSERDSVAFTVRRVADEAIKNRGKSSYGELVTDEIYAVSFYVNACLIAYRDKPGSIDFLRHRARAVTRELSQLLPMLDDDPNDPAAVAPIPD